MVIDSAVEAAIVRSSAWAWSWEASSYLRATGCRCPGHGAANGVPATHAAGRADASASFTEVAAHCRGRHRHEGRLASDRWSGDAWRRARGYCWLTLPGSSNRVGGRRRSCPAMETCICRAAVRAWAS